MWGRAGRDPRSLKIVLRASGPRISRMKDGERQPISRTTGQIREDSVKVKTIGGVEIFFDFNFSSDGLLTSLVIDRIRQLRKFVR